MAQESRSSDNDWYHGVVDYTLLMYYNENVEVETVVDYVQRVLLSNLCLILLRIND